MGRWGEAGSETGAMRGRGSIVTIRGCNETLSPPPPPPFPSPSLSMSAVAAARSICAAMCAEGGVRSNIQYSTVVRGRVRMDDPASPRRVHRLPVQPPLVIYLLPMAARKRAFVTLAQGTACRLRPSSGGTPFLTPSRGSLSLHFSTTLAGERSLAAIAVCRG